MITILHGIPRKDKPYTIYIQITFDSDPRLIFSEIDYGAGIDKVSGYLIMLYVVASSPFLIVEREA